MPIVHLIGPNAIGKSTAVFRWAKRYSGLTPFSLDLMRKESGNGPAKRQWLEKQAKGRIIAAESVYTNQIVQLRTLTVVSCDSESQGVVTNGEHRIPGYRWKGTMPEKEAAVARVREESPVVVCESARTTTTTFALPEEPIIIVTCRGETLGKHLRARCEAKGKRFRDDYWDKRKLEYEASRRYLNFAKKNLLEAQVKYFEVNDQTRDWPAVDEYFGSLYRKIHNQLVARR